MHRKPMTQAIVLKAALMLIVSGLSTHVAAQSLDTPMTRLKPLGAPSAVDAYRADRATNPVSTGPISKKPVSSSPVLTRPISNASPVSSTTPTTSAKTTAYRRSPVNTERRYVSQPELRSESPPGGRQIVLTQFEAPPLNSEGLPAASDSTPPSTPPPSTTTVPGNLAPSSQVMGPMGASGDYAPLAAPQLGGGFATVGNCSSVTAPSAYYAASANAGCSPNVYPAGATYQAPAGYAAPTGYAGPAAPIAVPAYPAVAPRGFTAGSPTPLVSFGQRLNPIQVGQGIFGQPVAYVPGQAFRNFIRYFFP